MITIFVKLGVAVEEQVLEHNGRILSDDKSIAFYGVGSDEILLFHQEIDLEDQSHEDKRRKVQEYIRMQNVFDNFEKAIVFNPESFVPTALLLLSSIFTPVIFFSHLVGSHVMILAHDVGNYLSVMRHCVKIISK